MTWCDVAMVWPNCHLLLGICDFGHVQDLSCHSSCASNCGWSCAGPMPRKCPTKWTKPMKRMKLLPHLLGASLAFHWATKWSTVKENCVKTYQNNKSKMALLTFQRLSSIKGKEIFKAWNPTKQHVKLPNCKGANGAAAIFLTLCWCSLPRFSRSTGCETWWMRQVLQFGTSHPMLSKGQIHDFTTAVPVSSMSSEGSASPAHHCLETLILARSWMYVYSIHVNCAKDSAWFKSAECPALSIWTRSLPWASQNYKKERGEPSLSKDQGPNWYVLRFRTARLSKTWAKTFEQNLGRFLSEETPAVKAPLYSFFHTLLDHGWSLILTAGGAVQLSLSPSSFRGFRMFPIARRHLRFLFGA